MKSKYVLQRDPKSFCPDCKSEVELLCREDCNNKFPWFYVCFKCEKVFEVGKGEVEKV